MNTVFIYILCLAAGYLFGSIMFAWVITRLVLGKDIRTLGNKNPGAANTFVSAGPAWGILTGLLDALKALIPILAASYFFRLTTIQLGIIGIGAILGHGFPLYFRFKGGRSAATIMGVYIFLIPYELLASFILIPAITLTLIKTNRGFLTPLGIIALSGLSSLLFNHPMETKIVVIMCGFTGLFMNRIRLILVIHKLMDRLKK